MNDVIRVKRFGDVLISAYVYSAHPVHFLPPRRQKNDVGAAQLSIPVYPPADLVSAQVGHHDVQKHEVWVFCLRQLQGFFAVPGHQQDDSFVLKILQRLFEERSDKGFVVCDEDFLSMLIPWLFLYIHDGELGTIRFISARNGAFRRKNPAKASIPDLD